MQTTHLITYKESLQMPENRLEEILDGESRIMPPLMPRQFALLHRLAKEIECVFPNHVISPGSVGVAIRRNPLRYRIPDISVYPRDVVSNAIARDPSDPYMWSAPVLIAECLSPSNRRGDVAELLADYELIGVPQVWFFYPEKRVFEKHVLENGRLHLQENAEPGSISLDELWRAFHGE